MNEMKLPWPERGKLWARLGIRLAVAALAVWLLWAVGLPLLSLFAPFVAALITAAVLHPLVRWLQRRLGVPKKLSALVILVLLFGLLGRGSAIWAMPPGWSWSPWFRTGAACWTASRAPWIRSRPCPPSSGP